MLRMTKKQYKNSQRSGIRRISDLTVGRDPACCYCGSIVAQGGITLHALAAYRAKRSRVARASLKKRDGEEGQLACVGGVAS